MTLRTLGRKRILIALGLMFAALVVCKGRELNKEKGEEEKASSSTHSTQPVAPRPSPVQRPARSAKAPLPPVILSLGGKESHPFPRLSTSVASRTVLVYGKPPRIDITCSSSEGFWWKVDGGEWEKVTSETKWPDDPDPKQFAFKAEEPSSLEICLTELK